MVKLLTVFIHVCLEQSDKEIDCRLFELERSGFFKCLIRNGLIVPQFSHKVKQVIIAVVSQYGPADLHLQLPNQNLLECLESFKCDSLLRLDLIKVFTLKHKYFLKGSDVVTLKVFLEDFALKLDQLVIIQESIVVVVTDPENSQ